MIMSMVFENILLNVIHASGGAQRLNGTPPKHSMQRIVYERHLHTQQFTLQIKVIILLNTEDEVSGLETFLSSFTVHTNKC